MLQIFKNMKKLLIILNIFVAFQLVNAQQKEQIADSKISGVTVFLNSAQISREAKITLNPGTNIILFEKLSQFIIPGSLQVEGDDAFTIVSVNSSVNFLQEGSERPEVKVMKKELNRVGDEIKINQANQRAYEQQQHLLIANHVFKGDNKGITVEDMLGMIEMYRTSMWKVQENIYDCEIKAKRMNAEYTKIQQQIYDLETKFNRYTSTVYVNLSASVKSTTNVKITYLVNNASWSANYDAKATDLSTPLQLTFKATVKQTTGEDWNNVKLKLSTGNPNKNKTKPELAMWYLYAYDEYVYKSNKKGKKDYGMQTEYYGAETKMEESENKEVYLEDVSIQKSQELSYSSRREGNVTYNSNADGAATVNFTNTTAATYTTMIETGVNAEYDIDIPYTILSDGKDNSVEIKKYEMPVDYSYYAVPKMEKDAFLVADITGWEKYNFIPGYVSVYINDTYTGRSYFDTQSVEDTLQLSMGRDQSVIVQRKKVKDLTGTGIIGGNKKLNMGYEITVRNTRKTPIKLCLLDQFPLSTIKEIEVTPLEFSGADYNKENGQLEWKMDVPAGESKAVKFNYSVKYPKDKVISNLGG